MDIQNSHRLDTMLEADTMNLGPDKEMKIPLPALNWEIRVLLGEILTAIDAAVADPRQCKATKDVVKIFCRSFVHRMRQEAYGINRIIEGEDPEIAAEKLAPFATKDPNVCTCNHYPCDHSDLCYKKSSK